MYDLIILGGGPGGYTAAERAGALGKSVLLIEQDKLGGVCLNRGCIPTKSFLHSAKLYDAALHSAAFGVSVSGAAFDYAAMRIRTAKVQAALAGSVAGLMKKAKATVVQGAGTVVDKNTVRVEDENYEGANLLLATGSSPVLPGIPGLAGNPAVVDSTGLLAAEEMAETLVVIGGGVIGIEFACFYALLGRQVTVIEMLPQICGGVDREIAMTVQRRLEGAGAKIFTGATVGRIDGPTVHFTDKLGSAQSVAAPTILAATGRKPNLAGWGLEALNLAADSKGIKVNDRAQTSLPGVYAAGDVTGRMQLAHYAARQGRVAAANMFGLPERVRDAAVPAVIYTSPEVAGVGLTEARAKEEGITARAIKMPLAASGRFQAETDGERGFMKAVLGERDVLLGLHIVGPYAAEMIGAACVMIENEMRAADVRELVFPHPTVAEVMKDMMNF